MKDKNESDVKVTKIPPVKKWWDTSRVKEVLETDFRYVRTYCTNNLIDSLVEDKGRFIEDNYYCIPRFKCEYCGAGNKKKNKLPACFYPMEVGYIYKCVACNESKHLNQFLRDKNPEMGKNHALERWHKKLTGKDFNCKHPPEEVARIKAERRAIHKKYELELKERNKKAYEERIKMEKN
tara:strand:- start:76 stop:615 length:540 start_codon:yes stop_codon:yes gene_type:complete